MFKNAVFDTWDSELLDVSEKEDGEVAFHLPIEQKFKVCFV